MQGQNLDTYNLAFMNCTIDSFVLSIIYYTYFGCPECLFELYHILVLNLLIIVYRTIMILVWPKGQTLYSVNNAWLGPELLFALPKL